MGVTFKTNGTAQRDARTAFMGLGHDMKTISATATMLTACWGEVSGREAKASTMSCEPVPMRAGYELLVALGREIRGR